VTTRFAALPVGQGDSFLLETANTALLVDGGKSRQGFPELLRSIHPGLDELDIVVCTHNDADHANGLLGLLDAWPGRIREVWLPGSWTYRLVDLLSNPWAFLDELASDIYGARARRELDGGADDLPRLNPEVNQLETKDLEGAALDAAFETASGKSGGPFARGITVVPADPGMLATRDVIEEWLELVDMADRIREIALEAWRRGAKIRWFDHREFARTGRPGGGERNVLVPLNSVERLRVARISALEYLRLTQMNRESLAFIAPAEDSAVVFTGDSDLGGVQFVEHPRSVLVTAPHHGSEQNAAAYVMVRRWRRDATTLWVRSDSRSKTRPGASYRAAGYERACTLCSHARSSKQPVFASCRQGRRWTFSRTTHLCMCK
jgi:hypothetical protein